MGPQTLATPPPPQVWGDVQLPQLSVFPHPSVMEPQFFPCAEHVVGVQLGWQLPLTQLLLAPQSALVQQLELGMQPVPQAF